jgi:PIN domain nuclease of toxin-antitoxin system
VTRLKISLSHATAVESLPLWHRDPFDRLLVARATIEVVSIVSVDVALDAYGVSRLW